MNGARGVPDGDRFIPQCPRTVTDSNAAVTTVTAVALFVSPRQGGTTDGNAVFGFREGTITERHGVRTECPVVIDVGPASLVLAVHFAIAVQIVTARFNVVRTYGKILARQSFFDHLIADCGRNLIKVLNPIRNCIRKVRGAARRVHTGDFSAVGNLIKQIFGDFLFFLLCQRLYICHASR